MPDLTAKRTLVKSPPELWEELSEVEGLSKHFGAFGEIKITKLEPEHTVAWEGEHASGTVSIEPSGWGTKVTLHAELPEATAPGPEPEPEPVAVESEPVAAEPEPVAAEPEPEAPAAEAELEPVIEQPDSSTPRRRFWAWLFRSRTAAPAVEPEPVAVKPEPELVEPEPEPVAVEPEPFEPEPVAIDREPVAIEPEPEPVAAEPEPEPEPLEVEPAEGPLDPERARLVLDEALDALGAAHHRPFSRG
jgi:hypothetical protein